MNFLLASVILYLRAFETSVVSERSAMEEETIASELLTSKFSLRSTSTK